ncbi:hypothetical protein WJX74_010864 [Apatococcus lobatus]|uniref:HCNGP-like protein n=1 Tax=Apatococcus lobatus TaxID=904363 RepID=A0AAW1SAQ8_9CHLO
MATALGGLVDAYVDSDDGEGEEVAKGPAAEDTADDASAGRVLLAPALPSLSAAPPTSPLQAPAAQLNLTPQPTAAELTSAPGSFGSGDILTAIQQQQQQQLAATPRMLPGTTPGPMGMTGTADSGVPLSPGLVQDPGASPVQGVVGDGVAGRTPEPEPDLSLPSDLPPPPERPCSPTLQALITNLLKTQRERGQTLNHAMKSHRDYRNPNFLQKMVEFCDIQQYGSCYPVHLWDPTALPPEDHATALLQEHAAWQDRRAAERQKRGRVDFTKATSAAAAAVAAVGTRQVDPRALTQAAARTTAVLNAQAAGQGASKRSKWDHGAR